MTYTVVEMEVSPSTYAELRRALENAGYNHAISRDGLLDMTHIAVTCDPAADALPGSPRDLPTITDHANRAHENAVKLYSYIDMDLVPCEGVDPVTGDKALLQAIRHDLTTFASLVAHIKEETKNANQEKEG